MLGGYMGRILWADLSTGILTEQPLPEELLTDFIGGYGVGARLLYSRLRPGIDPLGPDNILGVLTGPLTGTPTPTGTRWTVVGRSPLTGTWGDANGSGFFGVALRRAGYDGVFVAGATDRPVYLLLDDGRAQLRDASRLWGLDTYQVEEWVKAELGQDAEAACIGPAGEKRSLISGIVHARGRTAARSGLGAVMGSKRLKMIAARGSAEVPVADPAATKAARTRHLKEIDAGTGSSNFYRETGTPGYTAIGAYNGDSPVRNWRSSALEFRGAEQLEFEWLLRHRVRRNSCWRCPIGCWGTSRLEYEGRPVESHQPEYETASAHATLTLNNDYPSLIAANDLCNRYGLDTISAGNCVAFAIECFEQGLIEPADTGGIELRWGDHVAMNAMLEKLALRQDFGDVLADGVMRASQHVGRGSEEFAVHVGGQELAMHDPRWEPGLGVIYHLDATPGRHTQACQYSVAPGFASGRPEGGVDREKMAGRGRWVKEAACLQHVVNSAGVCLFGYLSMDISFIPDFMTAVTGLPFTVDDMLLAGERIANIRQAFNVREGINPLAWPLPGRAYGRPPLADGPTAGISLPIEQMDAEFLEDMGWTLDAAVPRPEVLQRLGLPDVAADLWGKNRVISTRDSC